MGLTGNIIEVIEDNHIDIIEIKKKILKKTEVYDFYYKHRNSTFFHNLITYMTSSAAILMVLQGEQVINRTRNLMGFTDPRKSLNGTIRKAFGINIEKNSVHSSDSIKSSEKEILFFY